MPALLGAVLAIGGFVSMARADGDPASDYLLSRQVFSSSVSSSESPAQRQLIASVRAANRAGFTIRVAVISSDYDLGSITALWRKPKLYARFLGLELSAVYKGRLLVVMPNGFGFNWPGHPVAPAQDALAKVPAGSAGGSLLSSAETAVRRLAAADGIALASPAKPATERAAGSRAGGGSRVAIIVAVAVALALLAAVLGLLGRLRRRRRSEAVDERQVPAGDARRVRPGWVAAGFAVLCGVAVGAPILVLGSARHGGGAPSTAASSIVTPPAFSWPAGRRPAPEFVLHDQVGRRVGVAAYRGRAVIVTFIDPLCRNLCPLEAHVLNDAVHRMPASQRPEILAVSVDVYGHADRRTNLLQDVRKWQLVPQWRWAVGRPSELAGVWRRYGVGVKVTTKKIAGNTINYITHTEAAFVLDASGHERALFFWPFYPQDVERTLRRLT